MKIKLLLLVGILLFGVVGQARAEDGFKIAGLGVAFSTNPYRGEDNKVMPVPLIMGEYKGFYIKGIEAGYHLVNGETLKISVLAAPRFMGFDTGGNDWLTGLDDREGSYDAGVRIAVTMPWEGGSLGAKLVTDVGDKSNGQEADVYLSQKIKGETWSLTPSAGVRFQSTQMVGYYYQVQSHEVAANRAEYDPDNALNYFGDATFVLGIAEDWVLIAKAGMEGLSSEIKDSPIVDEDYLLSGLLGVARKF